MEFRFQRKHICNEVRPLTLLCIPRKSTRNSLMRVHHPTNAHKCNISSCIMMCVFILVKSYSWQTLVHEQQCTQLRTGKRYTRKPCSENIQLRHRNCMYRFQDAYYKKLHIVNFKNISSIPCATTHTLQKNSNLSSTGKRCTKPHWWGNSASYRDTYRIMSKKTCTSWQK